MTKKKNIVTDKTPEQPYIRLLAAILRQAERDYNGADKSGKKYLIKELRSKSTRKITLEMSDKLADRLEATEAASTEWSFKDYKKARKDFTAISVSALRLIAAICAGVKKCEKCPLADVCAGIGRPEHFITGDYAENVTRKCSKKIYPTYKEAEEALNDE